MLTAPPIYIFTYNDSLIDVNRKYRLILKTREQLHTIGTPLHLPLPANDKE